MPEFMCRVAYPTGEIVERSFTADDEPALRRELEAKEYLILDLRRRSPLTRALADALRLKPRISSREFLFFNQELRALIRAGLPMLGSLDILIERRKNEAFKRGLIDIRERVKAGESLSDAFAAHPDMFSKLYSSSLASGERSGELPSVLERFVAYQQTIIAIQRKVTAALMYPAILMLLSLGLVALMVFYIVPSFNEFLGEFGTELPLITQILVDTATFCQSNWKIIIGVTVVTVLSFLIWKKSGAGRIAVDRLKMKIPLVGGIVRDYAQNRFTRTLGTLVAGGIPLVSSLELAGRAVGNSVFEMAILESATHVREGQSLWESLEGTGLFSDIAVEMIKVGESTGSLEEMLTSASDFTDEEIDYKLTRMVSVFEPLLIVSMAVVVGGMLLSLYLPLLRVYSQSRFCFMAEETQIHTEGAVPESDAEEVLSEELQAQKQAQRLGMEYVDLEHFEIDPELFRSIPVDLMFRYNFVPRHRTEKGLQIVVADPTDVLMFDELELLLSATIDVCVGTPTAIQEILKKSESSQRVLDEATEEFRIQLITEDEDTGEETLTIDRLTSDSSPIIKLVDTTIFNALQRRASDIHIETREREVVIKYRIDGVLYQAMEPIDKKFHSTIISRVKIMSELDISEKRVPQDGRFKLRIKGRTVDFRVSIMPSVHGEDCVIRILDKESTNREFSSLSLEVCGFEERDKIRLRRFIKEPYGMVLVTGPTGSGKTTTLYAALSEIKNEEDKIITIEDPVEYQLPGITQIPVNEKKGTTPTR
jgi:type II secretory pathway component PulF